METTNAKITSATISNDGNILRFYLGLEGDGWGCTYGCVLDYYDEPLKKRVSGPASMECIRAVMMTIGVTNWEDLVGKYCRVEKVGLGEAIKTIGHIIKDKWFNYEKFFLQYGYNPPDKEETDIDEK